MIDRNVNFFKKSKQSAVFMIELDESGTCDPACLDFLKRSIRTTF